MSQHLKRIPKSALNVYAEEYVPGDFLLHMAGKLYEMGTNGATAVAHQFDMISMIDDLEDIEAFFRSPYLLTTYSGVCNITQGSGECPPEDPRRLQLSEPLLAMSQPNRYRHVGMRYYWLGDWKDVYDFEGWNDGQKVFDPSGVYGKGRCNSCGASHAKVEFDTEGEGRCGSCGSPRSADVFSGNDEL